MSEQKSDLECFSKLSYSLYAQSSADHEKYGTLLNIAYKLPKGKEILNDVAFKGYSFMYESMFGINGACDYEHKVVRLDSYHRQQDLAPILIHECEHIRQVEKLKENTGKENPADLINRLDAVDFIKLNRALEADACAHQAAFAYQMKDAYPQVFEKEMQTPMMQAYVAEMDKSGDELKAMQSSFKAWYGYKNYQDSYEKQHVAQIQKNTDMVKKDFNLAKNPEKISNEQISAVCLSGGKSYIEPSFFNLAENMAVSEKTKKMLESTGDRSVQKLPVRGEKTENKAGSAVLKALVADRNIRG